MTAPSPAAPSALSLLLELGQAFHSTLELDPLLVSILRQMQSAACSENVAIWLVDETRATLTCTHAVGPDAEHVIGRRVPATLMADSQRLAAGYAIKIDDIDHDPSAVPYLDADTRGRTRNGIVAPLFARGEILGALAVANKIGEPTFTEQDALLVTALAGHAAVAIQNAQLYNQQRTYASRQRMLEQISRHLQQTLDIAELMPLVLKEVGAAIEAEAGSVWLLNYDTGQIICQYATGGPNPEAIKRVVVPMGKGIVGTSVDRQESIIIEDAQHDERVFHAADDQTGFVTRSLMCVPLVRQGRSIGAIEAVNKRNNRLFTRADLEVLRNIADSAALAIENARLYADLSASYDSTLDALAAALDLRDRETEGHSRRVVEYTARLAQQIGLGAAFITEIRRGALIHDIGKIGVPDAILLKPASLTPDERTIIERHPQAGYDMLLGIPYLKDEIQIVLAHQERWDGTGYPLRLKGEAIPLGARLFAVADTYDALTSDRPYRRGRAYAAAREIIAAEAGKQFDPQAVAAFLAIPQSEWEAIRAQVMDEIERRRAEHDERVRASAPPKA